MLRRSFVAMSTAAALAAKPFARPIGVNLFAVRTALSADAALTYKRLGEIGIQTLEVRPVHLQQHAAMIRDSGLKPVHLFIETPCITGAWEEWGGFMRAMAAQYKSAPPADAPRPRLEDMIELAGRHGVKRIGTSMLLPGERARAIEQINQAAEACAKAGIELYYHNHAFEFAGARGSRFLDQLYERLDKRVRLELDVFWVTIGGDDPAAVLDRWKGRVRSMHVKDVAAGTARGGDERSVPPSAFREAGGGTLDWRAILRAADRAGVEHYFIEQDHSPGDPVESVRKAFQYLRTVDI